MTELIIGFFAGIIATYLVPSKKYYEEKIPTGNHVIVERSLSGGVCFGRLLMITENKISFLDGTNLHMEAKKLIYTGKDEWAQELQVYEFENAGDTYQLYVTPLYVELNGVKHFGRFVMEKNIFKYMEMVGGEL